MAIGNNLLATEVSIHLELRLVARILGRDRCNHLSSTIGVPNLQWPLKLSLKSYIIIDIFSRIHFLEASLWESLGPKLDSLDQTHQPGYKSFPLTKSRETPWMACSKNTFTKQINSLIYTAGAWCIVHFIFNIPWTLTTCHAWVVALPASLSFD